MRDGRSFDFSVILRKFVVGRALNCAMEKLMQYIWEYRLWNPSSMTTNDGRRVRIIDSGLRNTDAGPDFFNAKIEIDGYVWAGNVEIHYRASDWKRHGHDRDRAYDSVVLHVVDKDDAPVYRSNGERIPQMVMKCSPRFSERYAELVDSKVELPCKAVIQAMDGLEMAEWVQSLAFERLQEKGRRVKELLERYHGSWEDACYVTLARNIGFGTNNDAFERLAKSLPLTLLHKHADSLLQLEALFFGQAGLLDGPSGNGDKYYEQLQREYNYLRTKFMLRRPEGLVWKSFRMRPQNFPWRRVALLAHYVHNGFRLFADILEAKGDEERLRSLFSVQLTGYWSRHYSFSHESPEQTAAIGKGSADIVLINTVATLYYVYGEVTDNYEMAQCAVDLLEKLPPERNRITALFASAGVKIDSALVSQAVIQLYNAYCLQRKCLYCRTGHRLLSAAARAD